MADTRRKPRRTGEFLYFDPAEHPSLSMDEPYDVPAPGARRPPMAAREAPVAGMPLSWEQSQHPMAARYTDPDAAVRVPALSSLAMRPSDAPDARVPATPGRPLPFSPTEHPALSLPPRRDAAPARPARAKAEAPPREREIAAMVARENARLRQEREAAIIERQAIEEARKAAAKYLGDALPPLTKRQHLTPRQDSEYRRFKQRPARSQKKA